VIPDAVAGRDGPTWYGDRLVGVLDRDLAFEGDPAYDLACLAAWFGTSWPCSARTWRRDDPGGFSQEPGIVGG
jgi:hypothetical protein